MSDKNTKKDYIEGVVREYLGSITVEITASLKLHQDIVTAKLEGYEVELLKLTDRITILENNQLSASVRRDALVAIIYNLVAIAQYQKGLEHVPDVVTPIPGDPVDPPVVYPDIVTLNESSKLPPNEPNASDFFGADIAISADDTRMVVGAYGNDSQANEAGAAYVHGYDLEMGGWISQERLLDMSGESSDYFSKGAMAVSAAGDIIVIGAANSNVDGVDSGTAYVFEHNGEYWEMVKQLASSDPGIDDLFGNAVAIAGDGQTIVVGARNTHTVSAGTGAGMIHVFKRHIEMGWTLVVSLYPNDHGSDDQFGTSVSIDNFGTIIAVGSPGSDVAGYEGAGGIYTFEAGGEGEWSQANKFVVDAPTDNYGLGMAVTMTPNGNTIVAGAAQDVLETGAAVVIQRSEGSWSTVNHLPDNDLFTAGDRFGYNVAVSIDSEIIAVSADGVDATETDEGRVYVYKKDGNGDWYIAFELVASDAGENHNNGTGLAIEGNGLTVYTGAPFQNEYDLMAGMVYKFNIPGSGGN